MHFKNAHTGEEKLAQMTAVCEEVHLTSMSSCVNVSGSSPIMLAKCRLPMLNSSICFLMYSSENFSGPAAARFFRHAVEDTHICLLSSWRDKQENYAMQ